MMADKPIRSSLQKGITYQLKYLKAKIQDLKIELRKEGLDKQKIHNLLFEVKNLVGVIKSLFKRYNNEIHFYMFYELLNLAQRPQGQPFTLTPGDFIKIFNLPKFPIEEVENISFQISMLLTLFSHASDKLSNEYYREKLFELIPKVEEIVESALNALGTNALSELGNLFAITSKWGFGENWAVAMNYLQTLEIVINKLLEKFGIKSSENMNFKEKFKNVIEKLRDSDVELAKLEEQLPSVFWDLRNKIVHAGYEPTDDELSTITTWILQLLEKFRALNQF